VTAGEPPIHCRSSSSAALALRGFMNRATVAPAGNNSLSIWSRFGPNSTPSVVVPVMQRTAECPRCVTKPQRL
jgi:hypothetical protein